MTETARERIADAIQRCQANWDRMLDIKASREEHDRSIANVIHFYSYIVLLETLRQRDEPFADVFAQWLEDSQGDGGAGEWLWEWQRDIEAGRPLSLPNLTAEES
jgi:hypothetical protein